MAVVHFQESTDLMLCIGQEVAISDWLNIHQDKIQAFADCTGDQQWIHTSVDRASRESVYGQTIAHGFLTLSLIPYFLGSCVSYAFAKNAINYGLNHVRFPHPVVVNSAVRARFFMQDITPISGGLQVHWEVTLEVKEVEKPACVAEMLIRLYF